MTTYIERFIAFKRKSESFLAKYEEKTQTSRKIRVRKRREFLINKEKDRKNRLPPPKKKNKKKKQDERNEKKGRTSCIRVERTDGEIEK